MFGFARKWFAYHAKEYVDPLAIRHLKEIDGVWDQHSAELEDFWRMTSPDECASLMVAFLEELRREWPREFSELAPEGLPDAISEGFRGSIKRAYAVGCMMGKGWISKEHLSDFNIYLGVETFAPGIMETGGQFVIFISDYVRDLKAAIIRVLEDLEKDDVLFLNCQKALAQIPKLL